MLWEGLMGYNQTITDFDLKLPVAARLAKVIIGKEEFLRREADQ